MYTVRQLTPLYNSVYNFMLVDENTILGDIDKYNNLRYQIRALCVIKTGSRCTHKYS